MKPAAQPGFRMLRRVNTARGSRIHRMHHHAVRSCLGDDSRLSEFEQQSAALSVGLVQLRKEFGDRYREAGEEIACVECVTLAQGD